MADYPTSLPTFDAPGTELSDPEHSGLHEATDAELYAALAELGLAPSGTWSTVRARLDALNGATDVTYIDSGVTAGSGWTIDAFNAYVSNNTLWLYMQFERTGGTISISGTSGDMTNQSVATLPASCQGTTSTFQTLSSGVTGRGAFGAYRADTGAVSLAAVTGTADIVNTDVISLGGCVRLSL